MRRLFLTFALLVGIMGGALVADASRRSILFSQAPVASGGGGGVSATFIASYSTNATRSDYTFPAVSLGSEAANRFIWVHLGSRDTGTALTTSSVTVSNSAGGLVSLARAIGTNNTSGGNLSMAEAWYGNVPIGTSGDIVVTFGETTLRANIGVFRVTGQGSFNAVGVTTAGTDSTMDVTGSSSGVITASVLTATTGTSFTWTGSTEQYDQAVGTSTASGALNTSPASGSNIITATAAASGSSAAVAVAILP